MHPACTFLGFAFSMHMASSPLPVTATVQGVQKSSYTGRGMGSEKVFLDCVRVVFSLCPLFHFMRCATHNYRRRLFRWAGHVSRMPMDRLPRQLLTGFDANPRPTGSPLMTWGRTLKKALIRCG